MTFGRQLRQLLRRIIKQELNAFHIAFPAIVVEYQEAHPDPWGRESTKGVLKGRAVIQPKYKRYRQDGDVVEMPVVFDVPVSWYRMGDFLFRFPLHKGDVVMCIVSERALDHLLSHRKTEHPKIKEICRLDDAVVLPFGIRTDEDPLTPDEYTDDLYIACMSKNTEQTHFEGEQTEDDPHLLKIPLDKLTNVAVGDKVVNERTGETGEIVSVSKNPGCRVRGCSVRKGDKFRVCTPPSTPLAKFIMRGNSAPIPGEVKFVTPQFTVISPSVDLGDYGGPNVARVGDTGCTKGGTDPVGACCKAAKRCGCGGRCGAKIAQRVAANVPGAKLVQDAFEKAHPDAIKKLEKGAEALDGGVDTWKAGCDALLNIAIAADAAGGPDKIATMTGNTLDEEKVADGIVDALFRAAEAFLALPEKPEGDE